MKRGAVKVKYIAREQNVELRPWLDHGRLDRSLIKAFSLTIRLKKCPVTIFCFYRKIQDALEKQNRQNFKKRDDEKRKVDEATEKAKELMRVKSTVEFCVYLDFLKPYWSKTTC